MRAEQDRASPTFSVVVPTYDRPALLDQALASVLAQSFDDFECIVVDDCSPRPVTVPDDPRFRTLRTARNGGPAAAVNAGLQEATGTYMIRLDDDDMFADRRLELALEGLARAPIALCWAFTVGSNEPSGRMLEGDVHDTILDAITPHMGTVAMRRDLYPTLDESFLGAEDVEWWLRASQRGPVATVPSAGYGIRRHAGERILHGTDARIRGSHRLLEMYASYFAQHPRAAAFRWRRIGLMALDRGDTAAARAAFVRSWRIEPNVRTLKHLARSLRPRAQPATSSTP
jgi:glycosyltransferase involved in cell wall biosynthesis